MSKKTTYPVQIFWSDEDQGYIALVADLPGCSAFGETAEEALRESDDAVDAWLEAAKAAGNPIPKPSQPPLHKKYSGKILVRVPPTLHGHLVEDAASEGVSLNQYVNFLLADGSARKRSQGSLAHYGVSQAIVAYICGGFSALSPAGSATSSFAAAGQVIPFYRGGLGTSQLKPNDAFEALQSNAVTQRVTHG